jgi:hypothetical protein
MRTQKAFVCAAEFSLFLGFAYAAAVPALAGGNRKGAENVPASRPAPALERKVFTNQDLETLASRYEGPSTVRPSPASALLLRAHSRSPHRV